MRGKDDGVVMNLQTQIEDDLWQAVKSNYSNEDYTGAILDAVRFLSDRLREKADLEGDGVSLVGSALGGKDPRLKVTRLQSETDKSIQRGTQALLRGIYQAIRNPRSHEPHEDDEGTANAIIVFIDYLLGVIGASKPPFTAEEFIERVFDPNFVPQERYAELLVGEIPRKKRLEVAFRVYRKKEQGELEDLKLFFDALMSRLTAPEREEFFAYASKELKTTQADSTMRSAVKILGSRWEGVDEIARVRVENKLEESVKEGRYDPDLGRCRAGAFGTWASNIIDTLENPERMRRIVVRKLGSSDRHEQEYVLKFFRSALPQLMGEPSGRLRRVVKKALDAGDQRFYELVNDFFLWEKDKWGEDVLESFEDFEVAEAEERGDVSDSDTDALLGDDDLPF